jgi:hypothetical protein
MSIFLTFIGVEATWLMLKKTGVNGKKALWLTALFGFGAYFWFIAVVGSAWYILHISTDLFLRLAIILRYTRKAFFHRFIIGLRISVVASCGSFLSVLPAANLSAKLCIEAQIKTGCLFSDGFGYNSRSVSVV